MDSAKKPQSEKARIASQRNLDAWEARQAGESMLLDNPAVFERGAKRGFMEGATFGFVLGSAGTLTIAWIVFALFR